MSIRDFRHFLKAAKTGRRTSRQIVLGNESADLDSAVSALMMAYYQHITRPTNSGLPLPLINIPKNELHLRADILFLFERLNIELTDLIFIDEVDLSALAASHALSLTLVDHNQLAPHQAYLKKWVTTIIDHHVETGRYNQHVEKTIQPVGSTVTLIWNLFAQTQPHALDRDLARILLAPVLVDTALLHDPIKTTVLDREAAEKLSVEAEINVKVFYDLLQAKKRALSHLTALEILKKDFKAWRWNARTGGISSTPQLIETLLETKPGTLAAAEKLAQENQFDFYMIMGSGTTPQPRRDLLVWSPDQQLVDQLTTHLQKSTIGLKKPSFSVQKTPIKSPFHLFHQENAFFSRKKMAAELHTFPGFN